MPFSTDRNDARAPEALAFDGPKRDFILDENGQYKRAHPVDAKVFNLCRIAAGTIRSAAAVGQTVSNIKYIDPQRVQASVDDRMTAVLAATVAAGEIRIKGIDIATSLRGRIALRVNYVNLVTGRNETAVV